MYTHCRCAQVGVPEQFLNELQVPCFLVDDGSGGVAEGMKPSRSAHTSDPQAIQRRIQHIAPEHVGIECRTIFFVVDEVVRTVVIRVLLLPINAARREGPK